MNEFNNKMKYFENVEKIPAEIYYHYTPLDALCSIMKSRAFRLTSLKSSNDKMELYYEPEEFLSDFSKVCDNEKDINTKKYFRLIEESTEINKTNFLKGCKKKTFPLALCLSEKKDLLREANHTFELCTYIDNLEKKLDAMTEELTKVKQHLKDMQENTVLNKLKVQVQAASERLQKRCNIMKEQ